MLVPGILITLGTGWLLSTLGVVPEIDWIWTLGLAMVGVGVIAAGGIDKVTVVVGPFFLLASLLSVVRQTGRLTFDVEVPIMVIMLGLLLLIARWSLIPPPKWMMEAVNSESDED